MEDQHAQERPEAVVLAFPISPSCGVREESEPLSVREAIGESLREERTAQGRTLADVASDAFVSLPYLSEVERGRKDVSSELLGSISDALEIEVADVLERAARRLRSGSVGGAEMQLLAA